MRAKFPSLPTILTDNKVIILAPLNDINTGYVIYSLEISLGLDTLDTGDKGGGFATFQQDTDKLFSSSNLI